jgi:hypothetical protein
VRGGTAISVGDAERGPFYEVPVEVVRALLDEADNTRLRGGGRAPVTHDLKCHPEPFRAVFEGRKTFEVRKNDRPYREGDLLRLSEWHPAGPAALPPGYTGRHCLARIVYMLAGPAFDLPADMAVLGILLLDRG